MDKTPTGNYDAYQAGANDYFSRTKALELAVELTESWRSTETTIQVADKFEQWLANSQGWTLRNLRKKDLDFVRWFDQASSEQRDAVYGVMEETHDFFPTL